MVRHSKKNTVDVPVLEYPNFQCCQLVLKSIFFQVEYIRNSRHGLYSTTYKKQCESLHPLTVLVVNVGSLLKKKKQKKNGWLQLVSDLSFYC